MASLTTSRPAISALVVHDLAVLAAWAAAALLVAVRRFRWTPAAA